MTYKSGVALDANTISDYIREAENKKKEVLKVNCPFCCCFIKGRITTGAKKYRYNGSKNIEQLDATVNNYQAKNYLEHYGECY